ncbi:ATP-binding protein [Streptomyces sp. NPDC090056]|uniref:ATP-binding protein n=1 Tax=Streptomyces sp. NPDC090056 TaxID=3365934 RepID=UPI0037FB1AD8
MVLDDDGDIARALHLATGFLTRVQVEHGLLISQHAIDLTQSVVNELATNARKYASGPASVDLSITGGIVEIAVWDSIRLLPVARAADADRASQHGLEIVMTVAQSFKVWREDIGKRITAHIALINDPSGILG